MRSQERVDGTANARWTEWTPDGAALKQGLAAEGSTRHCGGRSSAVGFAEGLIGLAGRSLPGS